MADEIIRALTIAFGEKFGGEYSVYNEGVFMNAKKPCFFIECEKAEKSPLLGKRYILRVHVKVTREDDRDEKLREADKIIRAMFDVMAWLKTAPRPIRGRCLNAKTEGGRLTARGIYDVFLTEENDAYKPEDDIGMMETLERK